MKAGIYIGKDNHGDTLLIQVYGEEPFFRVGYWNISCTNEKKLGIAMKPDRSGGYNPIVEDATKKQISQIDWDNVKLIEE